MFRIARQTRLSRVLGLGPAAAIAVVWAFLWAWALAGVAGPLSTLPGVGGAARSQVEQRASRPGAGRPAYG